MNSGAIKLRTFLDAGVPDSVGRVLSQRGHIVIYHRNVLPEKTPDQVVALTALENNAILVAIDHDMRQVAQRFGMNAKGDRFARLNLIRICCNEVLAFKRLSQAMTLIEHEWAVSEEKAARRLWVDVAAHYLRTNR